MSRGTLSGGQVTGEQQSSCRGQVIPSSFPSFSFTVGGGINPVPE